MAEIDTSIYKTPSDASNPFDNASKMMSIVGAQNQNRLFQQEFGANLALSQAYRESIDPKTGKLDENRLMGNIAKSQAAYKLPEAVAGAQAREKAGIDINDAQFNLALKQMQQLRGALSSLATKPGLTKRDIFEAGGKLVSEGIVTPQQLATEFASLPQNDQQLGAWVQQQMVQTMDATQRMHAAYGEPKEVDTGGQKQFVGVSPMTGVRPLPGGTFQKTLDPATATEPTDLGVDPTSGAQLFGTRQQFADQAGGNAPMGGGPGAVAPVAPVPGGAPPVPPTGGAPLSVTDTGGGPQPVGPGKVPSLLGTPTGGPVAAPGDTFGNSGAGKLPTVPVPGRPLPAVGTVGLQKTLPIGQAEAAQALGKSSGDLAVQLAAAADSSPQRMGILQNLESTLQNFTTGPASDWTKVGKAWVNYQFPAVGQMLGFDPTKIASQEEFTKQATQLAQQQFKAIGGTGTDDKLTSAYESNPNTALSKLGNQQIIALLKGNEDALRVKNAEWQQWLAKGNGPQTYAKFSADFNKQFDPRVFQSVYMSPAQRSEMLTPLSAADKKKFLASLRLAVDKGWVGSGAQ